ncbi:formylglycine-generating enzyme family protein [Silicimonas sp. MF1-12-2]|uniref:formylglycine-generating enzyme family protein n=1 Tax=Silicimonas sp. MF1-12-2 TaxID=3384793 RepID=UPI0039B6C72A
MIRWLTLCLALCAAGLEAQEASWPANLIDPAASDPAIAADLVLPMNCGGAMAFQRIDVPVDVTRPLADRAFRMGQSNADMAFSDYLKPVFLRGAFDDADRDVSYYYIARYEMNEAQYRAIRGDCSVPFKPTEGRAKGGVSWFEAVDLSRLYTEWLMANAKDALPSEGDRLGFLRLPTEPEWEFAVRGGVAVDPAVFSARRFFSEGDLAEYAAFIAPGQGRTGLSIMGARRKPNPLGLYDVYGNAEELMLEPFRMNAVGRSHGQPGGLVTRGGSVDLEQDQIYTARRNEYPLFSDFTGEALAGEFFGVRLVISAIVVSEDRYTEISDNWRLEADRPIGTENDPLATLSSLLDAETDPRRQDALSGLQLEFRVARESAESSLLEAAKSTFLSGAAFVDTLTDDTSEIDDLLRNSLPLRDRIAIARGEERERLMEIFRVNVERVEALRQGRDTFLLSYRSALETLAKEVEEETRETALETLTKELTARDQTQLLEVLDRFRQDLEAYIAMPDMDSNELLRLAIR